MREIKIGAAQFEARDADKEYNLGRIAALTAQAARQGAEIIFMPHVTCGLESEMPGRGKIARKLVEPNPGAKTHPGWKMERPRNPPRRRRARRA